MSETGLHVTGVPSREWSYNTRGELIAEDAPGTSFDRGYSFDGIGNRLRTAVNTTNTTTATGADLGTYFASSGGAAGANPVNQYGQVALPGQAPVAVVHDLDGNMTSGPLPSAPGSVSHFSWDAENRLTQVAVGGGGGTVSYRYDPFGRRIARILGNITELTLYDGWNPVAEYANTPQSTTISLKRTFVWGLDVSGSLQGAGGVGGLLAIREAAGNGSSKAGQAIFPAYDGNGNIIRLFNSHGATVASYAYDGFGNRINPAASDIDSSGYANENRYGFSTKPRDPLTGLLYYGYRWYDPATGRWPSRDPIGESGGVNLYGFVGNDGTNHLDKLGLSPEWHHELPNAFRAIFEKLKINIDDSNFGRIFNTGEHGWDVRHAEWNREWDEFLFDEEGNQIKRSKRDVLNKLEQMRGDSRFQKWYDHSSKPHLGYKDWKRAQRRLSYQKRVLRLNRMANRCSWSRSGHKKLSIFGLLAAAAVTAGSAHAESKIHDFMITALDDLEHVVDNPNDGDAVDQAAISIGALAESIGGDFAFLAAMEQAKGGMREFVSVDCCEEDR